jgi:acyl-CoA thioesterase-1
MSSWQARTAAAAAVAVSGLCLACGSGKSAPTPVDAATPEISSRSPAAVTNRPRIVVLGDSLTAGLGLSRDDAYPTLLQQRVDAAGLNYSVVNAGVSGDTSAGGLSRLDWALGDNPDEVRILIVALGGNDGLRGLPVEELEQNLGTIIERAQARHVGVILAGMDAPPNFGESYIVSFHQVYPRLAARYHVPLIPFLLQGVAGIDTLNQRDGIHPTAAGARIVANNVWAVLKPMIEPQPK